MLFITSNKYEISSAYVTEDRRRKNFQWKKDIIGNRFVILKYNSQNIVKSCVNYIS